MELSAASFFLERFYGVSGAYVVGDDPTTTFNSCGAVVLAAVLLESRSAETLARLTGLPAGFAEATLCVLEVGGHHLSSVFGELITIVHGQSEDMKQLEDTLNALLAEYWARMDSCWCDVLEGLREGYLFGGRRQWWLDAENRVHSAECGWIN